MSPFQRSPIRAQREAGGSPDLQHLSLHGSGPASPARSARSSSLGFAGGAPLTQPFQVRALFHGML